MANELPEVVPEVQSMPTTGWFCQTSGNARRRVTKNTSSLDTEGIYDVAGVPGHTHNANVVVSADADYSAYRQSALNVGTGIWGYGALEMPVGLLTDSVEPDHAEERFERAIERCVGYVSLFPENCTGHIQEPTRSIGEIRTLVAPKARLDTLTYVEERQGWRVPRDADDVKEESEREALVSDFPDVYIDVRPLTRILPATVNLDVSPGSLYLETELLWYRIGGDETGRGFVGYTPESDHALRAAQDTRTAAAAAGDVGALAAAEVLVASATAARTASWDGTLRFVWDYDSRSYKTQSAVSIILNNVREVSKIDGAALPTIYDYDEQNVDGVIVDGVRTAAPPADNNHKVRIIVTFGILETTTAFDGFCWLGNMLHNEEALNYATRTSGLDLAPRFDIEVLGIKVSIGPFKWIGMPAYRIPVGGTYAHPCSDILQENFGDGSGADLQYNHWDKFDAFTQGATDEDAPFDGFLRYQWRREEAEQLYVAAVGGPPPVAAPAEASRRGEHVFDFPNRSIDDNSGMFFPRTGGILGQLTASHYDPHPDFSEDSVQQYEAAFPNANLGHLNMFTPGIPQSNHHKFGWNAAASAHPNQCAPLIYRDGVIFADAGPDGLPGPYSPFGDQAGTLNEFTLQTTDGFSFPPGMNVFAGMIDALRPFVSDRFCEVAMTPLFYILDDALAEDGVGDFSGSDLYLGKFFNGERHFVPHVICNCTAIAGDQLQLRYDLSEAMVERGVRVTGGTLQAPTGVQAGDYFWIRGWSHWLHPDEGIKSNFDAGAGNLPVEARQGMLNSFKEVFRTGNKFPLPTTQWYSVDDGFGNATLRIYDYVFALGAEDFGGLYFETDAATATGRKLCFLCPFRPTSTIRHEDNGIGAFVAARAIAGSVVSTPCYKWNAAAAGAAAENTVIRATHAEVHAEIGQTLNMYILGPDWYRAHIGNDPYEAIRNDSTRLGAVFRSVKRISQHICAPVINPNLRIGASAPLNHDTRHLPPELRDFRLQLHSIDWGRLQAPKVTLNELTLYEFKGGVQKVGADQNIMYLPQFREFKRPVTDNKFEVTIFSELGSPSYFCFFCRSATTDILQQPRIKTLTIACETTQKKSNSINELSIGQLFHLTQRNVHAGAEYSRAAYKRRQTVLLSAEDVGLMGLKSFEYQKAKRVEYTFRGTTNRPGQLYVVFVYNNRGLHIDGRRLQVVTLHE